MRIIFNKRDIISLVAVVAAAAVVLFASGGRYGRGDVDDVAKHVERVCERRLARLEASMSGTLPKSLPDNMVIYRYHDDSLRTWINQFPIINDDINAKVIFPRLVARRTASYSPLSEIDDTLRFMNIGRKWYLAKAVREETDVTIGALEISVQDMNLPQGYSFRSLSYSGGAPITVEGEAKFKLIFDSLNGVAPSADSRFLWLALFLFFAALVTFQTSHRDVVTMVVAVIAATAVLASFYFWGRTAPASAPLFSPSLYASGQFFYSLGVIVLVNIWIMYLVGSLYIARKSFVRFGSSRKACVLSISLGLLAVIGLILYSYLAISSILMNSRISLELYKIEGLSTFTLLVYLLFSGIFSCIPVILWMIQPAFSILLGRHIDVFSRRSRWIYSILVSVYLVVMGAVFGLRRETERVEVWGGRLAMDRDVMLELLLKNVDRQIASDEIISTLLFLPDSGPLIHNRVADMYFSAILQDYNVTIHVNPDTPIHLGSQVSPGSHFFYSGEETMTAQYTGVFMYNRGGGLSRLVVRIDPKVYKVENGYAALFGFRPPGKVDLPDVYSYAKYSNGDLKAFSGRYAYPTIMPDSWNMKDGFIHFVNIVSDDETVIISRPRTMPFMYLLGAVCLMLMNFLFLLMVFPGRRRRRTMFDSSSYYRKRISFIILSSLTVTLVLITTVSVLFVSRTNRANMEGMMSEKVNSIQALLENAMREYRVPSELQSAEVMNAVDRVGVMTKSDVTLYSPDGKILLTTVPEVFEQMAIGSRIDPAALESIVKEHKRFHAGHYSSGAGTYYMLYAPVRNESGHILAIMCSPYTERNVDVEKDAVTHVATLLSFFILVLLLSMLLTKTLVNNMFRPLMEMGGKMTRARMNSLEHISYNRNDEVSVIVDAYNRMVSDLEESSVRLAQAERDKAWSGMARQVAHEIKNPLTPMKLQLQRIIRLKEKNAPGWEDKFDEVAKLVLDHIDILTDTANEFSTFAKLYSEEAVEIDLQALLSSEVAMFGNRDNLTIDFLGFDGAVVKGPKPQLTRVFVNLLNNAVQAIDAMQQEQIDRGVEPTPGKIVVSLRKGIEDGRYDIAFEDNGPGVAEENLDRLFSPNFTTKSSGSGLGLAISRNILERCGATIRYSRSFGFGGACFTISYPMPGK